MSGFLLCFFWWGFRAIGLLGFRVLGLRAFRALSLGLGPSAVWGSGVEFRAAPSTEMGAE